MEKKRKKRKHSRERKEADSQIPQRSLEEKGDQLAKELERLDDIIDQVLGEGEEDSELQAQRFVDGFKQEGGQ